MGDVAMTVPVIKSLVEQNPDTEIIMVSKEFFKPFFENIPSVTFYGVNLDNYKGIWGLYKLFKELKKLNRIQLPIYTMSFGPKYCDSFLNLPVIKFI